MTCYHPLRAFDTGIKSKKTGKPIYKILPEASTDEATFSKFYGEAKLIPCGKCIGCRLDYSKQWATRCMCEAACSSHSYFLTLTYDDEHLSNPSLSKKDMQKFMKDLREYYRIHYGITNIRFFGCGEYGSTSFRKHFHLLVFNMPIDDLKIYKRDRGFAYYNSKTIESIWKNGYCVIGDCTWESAAYVARYVVKKKKGKDSKEFYEKLGIEPEFVLMSRKPGIGAQYLELYKDKIYKNDEIILPNGNCVKPPHYFDKLMEHELDIEKYKQDRLAAAEAKTLFSHLDSNKSEVDFRHDAERQKLKIINSLKRSI